MPTARHTVAVQEVDGGAQVGQFALGVLVCAPALALAEAAVVEGQRGEARGGQPLGVVAGHLLLDAGERSGQDHRPRPVGSTQHAAEPQAVAAEGHSFGHADDTRLGERERTEGTSAYPWGWRMDLVVPDVLEESCATRQALERLAAKWRVLLIYALLAGPQRPAELRRRVPGITQKMLTSTLREMEADGLVERRVLKPDPPQHVEYASRRSATRCGSRSPHLRVGGSSARPVSRPTRAD